MKSKEIFSLAVRILGLIFLGRSLWSLPQVVEMILSGGLANFVMAVLVVACPLVVSYWLLRGAPWLTRLAYPDADEPAESEDEGWGAGGKKADG